MPVQLIPSCDSTLYPQMSINQGVALATTLVINATGMKVSFLGRVVFPTRTGIKNIRRVGIMFGAVVKAGGSGLTLSLQDPSDISNHLEPDGVQDQSVAVANGDALFATNTYLRSGAFSADRAVTYNDLLALVIEFDGGGRLGADSVAISGFSQAPVDNQCISTLQTGGVWAGQACTPNIVLEFDDGTFGTLNGSMVNASPTINVSLNTGSAEDEVGQLFQFPYPVKVGGARCLMGWTNTSSDCDVILYEGTTVRRSSSIDASKIGLDTTRPLPVVWEPWEFAANTPFRIVVKPTTANNVQVYYQTLNDANHRTLRGGGTNCAATSRVDGGAFTDLTTRMMFISAELVGFSDGGGGGGSAPLFRGS